VPGTRFYKFPTLATPDNAVRSASSQQQLIFLSLVVLNVYDGMERRDFSASGCLVRLTLKSLSYVVSSLTGHCVWSLSDRQTPTSQCHSTYVVGIYNTQHGLISAAGDVGPQTDRTGTRLALIVAIIAAKLHYRSSVNN